MDGKFLRLDEGEAGSPSYVPRLLIGEPGGEDWFRVADLADPDSGQLSGVLQAMAAERGYIDPRSVGAGFPLIASLAVGGLLWRAANERPIPALTPDRTWWRILPSANVTAIVVSQRPEYLPPAELGTVLHSLWDGILEGVRRDTGFPVRPQWSMLASAFGQWLTDWMDDDHPKAIAQAKAIFDRDAILGGGRPRVTWLDVRGASKAFITRKVCCFNYLGKSGGYCTSQCPIVPTDERLAYAKRRLAAN